ncbi:flagellar filament capping protein FliD [Bacillus sp. B-jedd]|uniref:flagellar filament capping protein FliD n=1 Tax=Bacillus sp. B-jedd TaxID=1476857 RepID=UPI0005155670|nr:flagellar filament capping protein FliD [Bacillus sp. B-jedd]CEG25895.1 flagellar capping protein [Bacillus sp. B-jedd]
MINNSTTLRISGLASGMNTDEIVANLVKVQSSRLNKMQQTKISTTWKSEAYRDVNKKVDEFRKAMEALRLQSTFNKQSVTSSNPAIEVSSAGNSSQAGLVISSATLTQPDKPAIVSFQSNGQKVDGPFSFTLNNQTIEIEVGTLDAAVAKINSYTKDTNVKAENVGGSLVLTSTVNGTDGQINISNIQVPNSDGTTPLPLNLKDTSVSGADAIPGKVTINGMEIDIASNTFTYDGVAFNLKANVTEDKPVSIQVGSDTEGIFKGIQTFVEKYNELIADLNGRLTEKRYREYPPLLDDQKKDMKENEIKLWDERAKSGLLTNDSTISSFLIEMRNSLNAAVENSDAIASGIKTLRDIGIDFSKNYRDNGKLVLDEAKLKGVLQTNLEDVKRLFTLKGASDKPTDTTATNESMHKESGFAWRIYDRLNLTISKLGSQAGSPNSTVDTESFIAKQLKALDSNIFREQDKVRAYESRLWKQFTAMEKALSQLNSQGSWLSSQLNM